MKTLEQALREQFPFVKKIAIGEEAEQDVAFSQNYVRPHQFSFDAAQVAEWKQIFDKTDNSRIKKMTEEFLSIWRENSREWKNFYDKLDNRRCTIRTRLGEIPVEELAEWKEIYGKLKDINLKESRAKVQFIDDEGNPKSEHRYYDWGWSEEGSYYSREWDAANKQWVDVEQKF